MKDWIIQFIKSEYVHIIAGLLITLLIGIIHPIAKYACIGAAAAGVIREIVDKQFDWKDLLAIIFGAIIGQLFIWLL